MTKPSFDLSPEQIRQLGYMAADAVAEQRAGLTSRPVFGKVGAGAAAFDEPPPEEGQPIAETLAFAREHILPFPMGNVREDGLAGEGRPRLTVYASDQVHHCVDKAVDLLGIGTSQLRKIPTDERFRIRMDLLAEAVAADRRTGFTPAIVVGTAGTVN